MVLHVGKKVVLVLQVSSGNRIALAVYPRCIVVVIGKRLVVPLEERIHRRIWRNHAVVRRVGGRAGQCVVPSTRVPLPTDVLLA